MLINEMDENISEKLILTGHQKNFYFLRENNGILEETLLL